MEIRKKIKKSTALTIATASILITALTMAYFTSSDAVTNRLNAIHGSVAIQEPKWDSTGQFMAQKSEPGMDIPKNPYGVNTGDVDLYIRLTTEVKLGAYEGNLTGSDTDDEIQRMYQYVSTEALEKSAEERTAEKKAEDENASAVNYQDYWYVSDANSDMRSVLRQ